MRILALAKEIQGGTLSPPLLRAEARRVWEFYRQGIVREAYFRADVREAVLILEARDGPSAKAILGTLPLVKKRSLLFDIIPFIPYDGFLRLFSETEGPGESSVG